MRLEIGDTAFLLVDVQEKLFPKMSESQSLLKVLQQAVSSFQILDIPIILTEQYPQGLGETLLDLKKMLNLKPLEKVAFSALSDPKIKETIFSQQKKNWIIAGIESHVCILQTAIEMSEQNLNVIVLEDATSSRNLLHKKIAFEEMRKKNIRITCLESCLFELLGHAKHPKFKEISAVLR